jgi:uncharacterized membrane protein YeaQ/YmgE (transglycosylase-associated protein family)
MHKANTELPDREQSFALYHLISKHDTSEVEMTLTGLLVLLLIAGIVGGIGQAISGYSFGGCLMSILVGFVGAYVGVWLAGQLGLPELFTVNIQGQPFPIVWGIIGSAILSLILGLFTSRRSLV